MPPLCAMPFSFAAAVVPQNKAFLMDNNSVHIAKGKMRKIGNARVSTAGQNLDRQIAALRSEGCFEGDGR